MNPNIRQSQMDTHSPSIDPRLYAHFTIQLYLKSVQVTPCGTQQLNKLLTALKQSNK